MNLIRKKQIEGLENDIFSSKVGSDIFTRSTSFSLGSPGVGEAHLDGDVADQITTLHINSSDEVGNRYSILKEFVQYDSLIITTESGNISKYLINSIEAAVDGNNEGHFILTLQHSFGYNSTFEHSSLNYYFRKSAAVDLIENEKVRAIAAENSISASIALIGASIEKSKEVYTYTLSQGIATVIPHTLGTEDIFVQLTEDGRIVTQDHIITNVGEDSITIQPSESAIYKIILIR